MFLLGNISAGKSTLLNSLIGSPLLPNRTQECTRYAVRVRHAAAAEPVLVALLFADKARNESLEFPTLADAARFLDTLNRDPLPEQNGLQLIDVQTRLWLAESVAPEFRAAIEIFDTPGIRALSQQSSAQLLQRLVAEGNENSANLFVWVTQYDSHLQTLEKGVISALAHQQKLVRAPGFQQSLAILGDQIHGGQRAEEDGGVIFKKEKLARRLLIVCNKFDQYQANDDPEFVRRSVFSQYQFTDSMKDNFIFACSRLGLQQRVLYAGTPGERERYCDWYRESNGARFRSASEAKSYLFSEFVQKGGALDADATFLRSEIPLLEAKLRAMMSQSVLAKLDKWLGAVEKKQLRLNPRELIPDVTRENLLRVRDNYLEFRERGYPEFCN